MITVYVWDSAGGGSTGGFVGIEGAAVGHAAMEISGGEPAGVIYVSWWPRVDTYWGALTGTPAHAHRTLSQEIYDEGGLEPAHSICIPGQGEGRSGNGLDQSAMKEWWKEWQRDTTYRLADRSCCTTIVRCLLSGGAEAYASRTLFINPDAIVWGPSDVAAIANASASGIAASRY